MRTSILLLVCFTAVVRGDGILGFFYDATHISVKWTFSLPCNRVKLRLMSQIDKWSTAYNCRSGTRGRCLYHYISDSDKNLVVEHEWPDLSYHDTIEFNFEQRNGGQICEVSCHSEGSEFFDLDWRDGHYCSMRYLLEEQESQLIALIPLKDDRLKPRRTKLWVCLAVFMCLLIAGLVLFFMFPRSVNIESLRPYLKPHGPVYINVSEELVSFILINSVNVSNENYFSLKVTGMKVSVLYDTQVIAQSSNSTSLDVPMRSKEAYFIGVNVSLDKHNQMGYMVQSCQNPIRWAHEMVMLFDFTCNYEYLGHSEQTTLQTFQFVSCYSDVKPTTAKPTTSRTTTHTTTETNDKF